MSDVRPAKERFSFVVDSFANVNAHDLQHKGSLRSQSVECLLMLEILKELRAIRSKLEEPEAL